MAVNVHEVCSEKSFHFILSKSDAKSLITFFKFKCNTNNNVKI